MNPVVSPSAACASAVKDGNTWTMKSGYGFNLSWSPTIVAKSGYTMPSANAYTSAQCVYATIPEYSPPRYRIPFAIFRSITPKF